MRRFKVGDRTRLSLTLRTPFGLLTIMVRPTPVLWIEHFALHRTLRVAGDADRSFGYVSGISLMQV
jgi:hypothetical protein